MGPIPTLLLAIFASIACALLFCKKVTGKKALNESELRFRQLAENINDVFWITNIEKTEMIYISPAYEQVWGRTCKSLYENPRSFLEAIHPEDRERVINSFPQQIEGKYIQEYRILRPNDEIRWIRVRAFPIRNEEGKTYRIAGISQDITETKRIEGELSLLANVSEMSIDAISAGDINGKFTLWNNAAEKIFGFKREEILGKDVRDTLIPPERLPEVEEVMRRRKKDKHYVFRMRTERMHKDGRRIPVMITSFPLLNKDGEIHSIAGIHQDLSEYVTLERKLMSQSRMAAIGEMAAGIAHEIRNPLFGISSVAQIIAAETPEGSEMKELSQSMLTEISRLNRLLEDLLLYSKPKRLRLEAVCPKNFVEDFRDVHGALLQEKRLSLKTSFSPETTHITIDSNQMRQVILNLSLNAIQASNKGQVIGIRSQVTPETGWTFEIHNEGNWISPEHLSFIFDPFFSTKESGSGLGLSVCKKIVEEHGGTISCTSSSNDGTRVTLHIPAETCLTRTSNPV